MTRCKVVKRNQHKTISKKVPIPILGVDGDMCQIESDFEQDFRIFNGQDHCRGIYYNERRKSFVYVGRHEKFEEIYASGEHEGIHGAIDNPHTGESESYFMSVDEEHIAIQNMMWANETLIEDFNSIHNAALRDEIDESTNKL